jgi:hypothetical protein
MAVASRFHLVVSLASCFRPAAVANRSALCDCLPKSPTSPKSSRAVPAAEVRDKVRRVPPAVPVAKIAGWQEQFPGHAPAQRSACAGSADPMVPCSRSSFSFSSWVDILPEYAVLGKMSTRRRLQVESNFFCSTGLAACGANVTAIGRESWPRRCRAKPGEGEHISLRHTINKGEPQWLRW